MNFLTKKKKFSNGVEIHATYALKEGKVWLTEQWFVEDEHKIFQEPEPWDTDDVWVVANRHDWGLYIEVPHM